MVEKVFMMFSGGLCDTQSRRVVQLRTGTRSSPGLSEEGTAGPTGEERRGRALGELRPAREPPGQGPGRLGGLASHYLRDAHGGARPS